MNDKLIIEAKNGEKYHVFEARGTLRYRNVFTNRLTAKSDVPREVIEKAEAAKRGATFNEDAMPADPVEDQSIPEFDIVDETTAVEGGEYQEPEMETNNFTPETLAREQYVKFGIYSPLIGQPPKASDINPMTGRQFTTYERGKAMDAFRSYVARQNSGYTVTPIDGAIPNPTNDPYIGNQTDSSMYEQVEDGFIYKDANGKIVSHGTRPGRITKAESDAINRQESQIANGESMGSDGIVDIGGMKVVVREWKQNNFDLE